MIDKKKIEEAALKHSADSWLSDDCRTAFEDGFSEGINWLLYNLWHDASEKPEKNKLCLVKIDIIDGFKVASDYTTSSFNDKGWTENYFPDDYDVNVSSWLYIEDLIKGEK